MSEHRQRTNTQGLLASYVSGFVLSIGFTLVTYVGVIGHWFHGVAGTGILLVLALVQFVVQLVFFLHVGRESRPRWRLLLLVLMIFFAVVVIAGSIWVIYSLNYHMMPGRINQYMQQQSAGGL